MTLLMTLLDAVMTLLAVLLLLLLLLRLRLRQARRMLLCRAMQLFVFAIPVHHLILHFPLEFLALVH